MLCARAVELSADGKRAGRRQHRWTRLWRQACVRGPGRSDGARRRRQGLLRQRSLSEGSKSAKATGPALRAAERGGRRYCKWAASRAPTRARRQRAGRALRGGPQGARPGGQRRGVRAATAEAAARREVAARVAQLVDKNRAGRRAAARWARPKSGPSTPKRRPAARYDAEQGARSPISTATRSTAGTCGRRAPGAADAVRLKRGLVVGDRSNGRAAVTATRTTLAEALACRGETSSDAELCRAGFTKVARRLHISSRRGEARSLCRARVGPRGTTRRGPGDRG